MVRFPRLRADGDGASARAAGFVAERRSVGRVAGIASMGAAVVALMTLHLFSPDGVPFGFDLLVGVTVGLGMGFVLVPWDRLPAWMLHPMPLITIAETAVGIRLLGAYDDVAVNYYVRQGAGTARARGGLLGHRG